MKSSKHQIISERENIFGPEKSREQVMGELKQEPKIYGEFQKLSGGLQKEFLEFCMGVRGLSITYDPVFKKIFNPEYRLERLEEFLSLCLGEKVKIIRAMPNESERLTEEGSLLVMDILVQLESGTLVNIEIQRIGYLFPGARCACYASDLLMRQYSQVREERRRKGQKFSYHDMKDVFIIVLLQESTAEFQKFPKKYLHYIKPESSTGLKLNMLQNYLMIPLDIFQKILQNRDRRRPENKLEAWLMFISSDSPEDIMSLIDAYPEFERLYKEVFEFRYQKRELISMYSEALRIMDANMVEYMVEQQKKELRKQEKEIQKQKDEIAKQNSEIQQQNDKIVKQNHEIAKRNDEIAKQNHEIAKQNHEIAKQNDEIAKQNDEIAKQNHEIENQKKEIQRLRALLGMEE